MIIIRYKGGLGNQMFQYAMQLALVMEKNMYSQIHHIIYYITSIMVLN